MIADNVFYGRVDSIDRANHTLRATLDTGEPLEDVTYDSRPRSSPWPWCRARFTGPPWRCLAPCGRREPLFEDHFTHVSQPNGDTAWAFSSVGTIAGTMTARTGEGVGVARLRPGDNTVGLAGSCTLRKDTDSVALRDPLWFLAKLTQGFISSSNQVGFLGGAYVNCGTFGSFLLVSGGFVSMPDAVVSPGTYSYIDLIVAPGVAAASVDGGTMYAAASTISEGDTLTPGFYTEGDLAGNAPNAHLDVDLVACHEVTLHHDLGF